MTVRTTMAVSIAWALQLGAMPDGASSQVPVLDTSDAQAAFMAMGEYLARDGGRWRAPNPNADGSANTPPAFGLWFSRHLDGRVLELEIVIHFADRTVVSSHGQWTWHPGRGEVTYVMTDRRGGLTEGTTTFPDPATFRTIATHFGRRGNTAEQRDDNVLVSEDLHRNETFQRDGDRWVSGGVYEWRRQGG